MVNSEFGCGLHGKSIRIIIRKLCDEKRSFELDGVNCGKNIGL